MKIIKPAAVIYLRKSREDVELEARGEGETLARHRKMLLNIAEREGLNIVKIYEEIVSGDSIDERPQVQKLLNEILQGKYSEVVVMEIQRLARGATKDQGIILEAFEISGAKIVTPQKTYDPNNEQDMEAIEFGLLLSRREYKAISRRMQSGVIQSVYEGNYVSPLAPYGYDILKRGKRDRTLVPNQDAETVRKIFEWSAYEGMSCGEIGKRLTLEGIPTRNNAREWLRGTILSILKNETYTGKIRWNNRKRTREYIDGKIEKTRRNSTKEKLILVEGKHEPIIPQELFDEVQKNFGKVAPTDNKKLINIFAGILKCQFCGRCMVYNHYKASANLPRYTHPVTNNCGVKSTFTKTVIDSVIQTLKEKLHDVEIELKNFNTNADIDRYKVKKSALKKELEKLKKKKSNLFDLLEDGYYTKEEFLERKEKIIGQIEHTENELEGMIEPTENEIKLKAVKLHEILESLKSEKISVNRKNQLVKSIISRIDYAYNKDEVEVNIFFK